MESETTIARMGSASDVADARAWRARTSDVENRRDLVATVIEWAPFPFDHLLVVLDRASAMLESGDPAGARALLAPQSVRTRLAELSTEALGTGDLERENEEEHSRSRSIAGVLLGDLVGLAQLAADTDDTLSVLAAELGTELTLREQSRQRALQTVLSTAIQNHGIGSLMGEESGAGGSSSRTLATGLIDLALVPARYFAWYGAETDELRAVRSQLSVSVTADVSAGREASPALVAFVADRDGTVLGSAPLANAPLGSAPLGSVRAGNDPSLVEATVEIKTPWGDRPIIGVCAPDAVDRAVTRAQDGVASAERFLLQSFIDQRLALAAVLSGDFGRRGITPWLSNPPGRSAARARDVAALTASSAQDARRLRADIDAYLSRSAWDSTTTTSGPNRPLISELLFTLDHAGTNGRGVR